MKPMYEEIQRVIDEAHELQCFLENCDPYANAESIRNATADLCGLVNRLARVLGQYFETAGATRK